ncbi:MAG: outer membrane beta-barrel protein [Alistipes sp.]|nr:outer membrane beta-barrel protein [Candidatus Alistipes equi]
MKKLFIVIMMTLMFSTMSAQCLLKGRVADTDSKAVPYATVSLQKGQNVITAVASLEDGTFQLKVTRAGKYQLEVSSVGYSSFRKEITTDAKTDMDLGTINLSEGVEVGAVAVTVQKPIVTVDAEKLSYSVEDDPVAQSSTLEDVIRKVPQLSIDAEGNVLMNGQSGFKILVNGHESKGMATSFKDIIKAMPASSIKKIEVVTNPSMKYDAEGAGGVLNIILATAKKETKGYSGSLTTMWSSMLNRNWGTHNSASFNMQSGKFSMYANFSMGYENDSNDTAYTQTTNFDNLASAASYTRRISLEEGGYKFNNLHGSVNASYEINNKNLITAEMYVWNGHYKPNTLTAEDFLHGESSILKYRDLSQGNNAWYGYDLTISYEHTFKKDGHKLTISDNVSFTPPTESWGRNSIEDIVGTAGYKTLSNQSLYRGTSNSLQVDYINPLTKKHSIEAGLKHNWDFTHNTSENYFDTSLTQGLSDLSKNILALYAGYAYTAQVVTLRAGTRVESAWYSMRAFQMGEKKNYSSTLTDAIPYASITILPKMGHMLSISYSERLSRPGIEAMSPYVDESLTTRSFGNPNLKTGMSHNLNVKYALMSNKWNLTVGYTGLFSSNQVARYSFLDEDGIINNTYSNSEHVDSHMGNVGVVYRPSQKFSFMFNMTAGWHTRNLHLQNITCSGWSIQQSATLSVKLWKGATLTATEFTMRMAPQLQYKMESTICFTQLRLGQKFLKDRMELSLTAGNPHSREISGDITTKTPTYVANIHQCRVTRSLQFALTYRFGKNGLSVKKTSRNQDTLSDSVGNGNEQSSGNGFGM